MLGRNAVAKLKGLAGKLRTLAAAAAAKRSLRIGGLVALGIVLLMGAAFFSLRNLALRSLLDGKIRSYRQGHPGTVVEIGAARFAGLSRIELENIVLRSDAGALAMDLRSLSVSVSFWNMLVGKVRLTRLELDGLAFDLHQASPSPVPQGDAGNPAQPVPQPPNGDGGHAARQGDAGNPARPVPQSPKGTPASQQGRPARRPAPPDYAERAATLLHLFFTRVPDTFVIQGLTIRSEMDGVRQTLHLPRLEIAGPDFETTIEVNDLETIRAYYLTGSIHRGKKRLAIHLLPLRRGDAAPLPFIDRQWGLRASFASLSMGLESRGRSHGVLRLDGSLAVKGLVLNHPRIAAEDVNLPAAALDYVVNIGPDYFELDDRTRVTFDKLRFRPYLKLKTRPTRQVALKVKRTVFPADDLFSSLPAGLFTTLAGIRTSGELAYHLDFAIDLDHPEAVELESELEKVGFKIEHFGRVDFRAVNAPFTYTAYERDRAVHSLRVGPENPNFVPLHLIPPWLQNAVMISEDGAFFAHRGFLMEPIRDAIVANLRQGRFARGASTISMQLVKNLYLRRHKTMARKLEEMLITWLIEEKRLISKERMFEIYLNIIEWGPGIYGVQEAARYYFAKDAAGLTLPEAIFMASIIPRPKRFMVSFDENQRLRPWLQHYYADVARKMLAKGWISQLDHDTLVADVELKGPARLLLKPIAVPADEPYEWFESEEPFQP